MAKGSRSRSRSDAMPSAIANRQVVRTSSPSTFTVDTTEDRRFFHPEAAYRPPLSFIESPVVTYGLVNRNVAKPVARYLRAKLFSPYFRVRSQTKAAQAFTNPSTVWICVRRKARREVLHALKRTTGFGKRRKPRRNAYSKVRC